MTDTTFSGRRARRHRLLREMALVWVALCIVAGIARAYCCRACSACSRHRIASVNLVVAVLIWAMVFPMMVNVDFASLRQSATDRRAWC